MCIRVPYPFQMPFGRVGWVIRPSGFATGELHFSENKKNKVFLRACSLRAGRSYYDKCRVPQPTTGATAGRYNNYRWWAMVRHNTKLDEATTTTTTCFAPWGTTAMALNAFVED